MSICVINEVWIIHRPWFPIKQIQYIPLISLLVSSFLLHWANVPSIYYILTKTLSLPEHSTFIYVAQWFKQRTDQKNRHSQIFPKALESNPLKSPTPSFHIKSHHMSHALCICIEYLIWKHTSAHVWVSCFLTADCGRNPLQRHGQPTLVQFISRCIFHVILEVCLI